MTRTERLRAKQQPLESLLPFVAPLVAYGVVIALEVGPTFTLPWWTNTEEFPYAQEVVRFLSGDFHQRFFDIPGTPLMVISTALFAIPHWVMGLGAHGSAFSLFSRQMTALFELMRAIEVIAFVASGCFIYLTTRRFASRWASGLAAAVLAASPVLYTTIGYTRIEAMGVMLVSASIYVWVRGLASRRLVTFAGVGLIAGVAMAARFPLGLATLPMFAAQALVFPSELRPSRWTRPLQILCVMYGFIVLVGATLAWLLEQHVIAATGFTNAFFLSEGALQYTDAFRAIDNLDGCRDRRPARRVAAGTADDTRLGAAAR